MRRDHPGFRRLWRALRRGHLGFSQQHHVTITLLQQDHILLFSDLGFQELHLQFPFSGRHSTGRSRGRGPGLEGLGRINVHPIVVHLIPFSMVPPCGGRQNWLGHHLPSILCVKRAWHRKLLLLTDFISIIRDEPKDRGVKPRRR